MQQAATAKSRQRIQSKKEESLTLSEELQDSRLLHKLLDEIAQGIKQSSALDPSLTEKILLIKKSFDAQSREAFTAPIKDWEEFKERLGQIVCAQKQARFDSGMETAAKNLLSFLRTIKEDAAVRHEKEKTVEYWKAHTLLYELNDIFHLDTDISKEVMLVGKDIYNELQKRSASWDKSAHVTRDERRLLREKVIFCACRGNELKRSGKTEEAQIIFEWLLEFTAGQLGKDLASTESVETGFPCLGTQANLAYHLGSIYRILERHNDAEEKYMQTLNLFRERARLRCKDDPDDHLFTARKQAMAVGIGFGWVNLTRGFLRRAENAITTARSLLAGSSDPVVPAYIELLYGTIRRCRAGTDPEKLRKAIEILEKARDEFKAHGHSRYVPRACWELSLAFTLAGKFAEAQEQLNFVADYAERIGHPKWQTNVSILRSRILRHEEDYQGALEEARLALMKAQGCKSILPLVDSHITFGEAKLAIAEKSSQKDITYAEARAEFEKALHIALQGKGAEEKTSLPSNPKIVAVCHLGIAECYAKEWDETKAREHFAKWEGLRSNVEHEWVRERAATVKREIDGLLMNFTISAKDSDEWDYAKNVAKLRQWLLSQALRHSKKNYSVASDLVGVKRATLYQWQGDSKTQSKRARINGNERQSKKKGERE